MPTTKHLRHKSGRAMKSALARTRSGIEKVPGPSPNPATNVLIAEILVRSGGRMARRALEKGMLKARFEREQAVAIIEGRGLTHTLISTAVARVATRSVPGALLVSGGLLAKTLYDRSISRRQARRSGRKMLKKQADNAD